MTDTRVPVLIVGSGLAGLTTAVMLAWRGIRPLLVERHTDTSKNPRARGVNFRSMELPRVAGLEPDLMTEGGDMNDFSIIVAEYRHRSGAEYDSPARLLGHRLTSPRRK